MSKLYNISGFSLIEVIVVIVVLGIVAAVAMQSMTASVEDIRRVETEREMETLAKAIVGDASLIMAGTRADFGYVGDIGAFPPDLQALYRNPGGYTTWNGPYIPPGFIQDTTDFKVDGWGEPYAYSGGITITSNGGGSAIIKKIADASSDYLRNRFNGTIHDAADSVPGSIFMDSINVVISHPDGGGNTLTKSYRPDSAGAFMLDSLPIGTHPLRIVYTPTAETLLRYVTILPRHKSGRDYRFADARFTAAPASIKTMILRPENDGTLINLDRSGCAANFQCVNEIVPDGNGTCVIRGAGTYATDVYLIENPVDTNGTITQVAVYCRARKSQNSGRIRPILYVNSIEYNSPPQNLSTSWIDHNYVWTTSPATGTAWTWQEIIDLQAGLSLSGQNINFPAYCTQVWVEVTYSH